MPELIVAERPVAPPVRSRFWSAVLAVVVVAMVAMWGYVVYLAFGPGRAAPPDRLDSPAFAAEAQTRCRAALDAVAALPPAKDSRTARERARVLDQANATFGRMLDDLTALSTLASPGEDRDIVTEWIADWRVYVADREEFAESLRSEPRSRLLVTAKGGQQITDYINEFAKDNMMPACGSPIDA